MTVNNSSPPSHVQAQVHLYRATFGGHPNALSSPGLCPTHQVLGWLGQDSKGGQVLALAAGVSRLGLQGLTAVGVPVPRAGIS